MLTSHHPAPSRASDEDHQLLAVLPEVPGRGLDAPGALAPQRHGPGPRGVRTRDAAASLGRRGGKGG